MSDESAPSPTPPQDRPAPARRTRWLAAAIVIASFSANAVLGSMVHESRRSERDAQARISAMRQDEDSRAHAMKIAVDYARGAAELNYKDMPSWTKRLTSNTSAEMSKKLKDAAATMEQVVVPLHWVSTPTPIASTVRTDRDGVFVVNCFMSVITKNVQAPDGIQATATYTVTVNKNDNWMITDVGGVDTALRAGG
ncbi:hypothetical protein [Mycobacteroides abscessus]|uniref:hypothetical protein n=1 Tax=Mycobacteroides abscessus TaxID=36809 RepID=UPI0009CC8B61|nr:hypothetical protein [Mycobacteroides abscessus]SLG56356.1 Uncharacterised protein [Mycobacteroides abscessus subsp. abscessus]